jgi:DNA-binding FrmR family transcriptional regulator
MIFSTARRRTLWYWLDSRVFLDKLIRMFYLIPMEGMGMLNDQSKKEVLGRLKKIEGQIRGIEKMVDQKRYCIDILNQVVAVRRALDSFSMVLMKQHVGSCVSSAIKANKGEKLIDELINSIERFVR